MNCCQNCANFTHCLLHLVLIFHLFQVRWPHHSFSTPSMHLQGNQNSTWAPCSSSFIDASNIPPKIMQIGWRYTPSRPVVKSSGGGRQWWRRAATSAAKQWRGTVVATTTTEKRANTKAMKTFTNEMNAMRNQ